MKKISGFLWAFIALVIVFLTAGAFMLGTTKHTGKSLVCETEKTVYYTVSLESGDSLAEVYVNVGSVYLPVGGDANLYVKYSTSSTSTTNWKRVSLPISIANLQSETGVSGSNYHWLCYAKDKSLQNVKRLSVSAEANIELCEIICLNQDGEVIPLSYGENGSKGADYKEEQVAKTLDAQESFYKETGAYYAYTQEEGEWLTSVNNVLLGTEVTAGNVYSLARGYNYLATLLHVPAVAVFGGSPFALRITPFIALCVGVVFLYLLVKEFLKKDGYAFCAGVCGMAAALAVLRTAGAGAFVASALLGAAYFAARFFARGISSKHIVKGGLNILFAGVFAAVALATDTMAIFGVLGVLTLLGFGLRRQYLAYKLAMEKSAETSANIDKLRYEQDYKNRVAYCFGGLAFIAVTFVLILFAAVASYPAIMRVYGSSTGFVTAMWKGVKAGAWNKGMGGRVNVWKWFIGASAPIGVRIACIVGAVSLIASTAFVVLGFIQKTADKRALRVRRAYFVLLGAVVSCVAAALVKGGVTAMPSVLFLTAYVAFFALVLASAVSGLTLLKNRTQKGDNK